MKSKNGVQYTIRKIPRRVDDLLRQKAKREGKSLNTVAVEALAAVTGFSEETVRHHDLDDLAGTWVEDEEFEEAIRAQDQTDPALWQ